MFDNEYASNILECVISEFENGEKYSITSIPELNTFLKCSAARSLFRTLSKEKGISIITFFWPSKFFSDQIDSPYFFVFVRNPISWIF